MKCEIISVGNEVLRGDIVDTNSSFLGRELTELGHEVVFNMGLPDKVDVLKEAFSSKVVDIMVVTGGLGPTLDDVTREAAQRAFNRPLEVNKGVFEAIRKRFGEVKEIENQSLVLRGATVFPNSVGTAPGFAIENGSLVIFLPGVPREMEEMFLKEVKPYLEKKYPAKRAFFKELNFCLLKEAEIDPYLRDFKEIKCGVYPSLGTVRIVLEGREENVLTSSALLEERLKEYVIPTHRVEEAIHDILLKKGMSLSVAESCSGGCLAYKISSIPGASKYFLGGIVAYSNEIKKRLLKARLEKGAVSRETVLEMLDGLLSLTGSDYGITTSGIAGPSGGTEEKPVGTVWIAVGKKGDMVAKELHFGGNRMVNMELTANYALGLLWQKINCIS